LFWVISGFVFAHVYINRGAKFRNFVIARFARLYPLHLATLIIVAGVQLVSVAWVGHWQIYGNNDLRHFGLQLLMSSNWTTLSRGLSFNGPIWSVSLEFLAYGLFLIALPMLRHFGLIAAVALAAVMWWLGFRGTLDIPGISRGAFICAEYFFLGNCVYLIMRRAGARQGASLALIGITILLGVWSFWSATEHLMETSVSVAVVGVVALADVMWRGPTIGWLKRLGDMSYSIYLVHVPLQMVTLFLDDVMFAGSRAFATSLWTLPIYLFVTVWLADFTYRQFEIPASRALRAKLLN
jgi:peptidoglycan/LPS O-acetylase OafA/YrhL